MIIYSYNLRCQPNKWWRKKKKRIDLLNGKGVMHAISYLTPLLSLNDSFPTILFSAIYFCDIVVLLFNYIIIFDS